MSLPDVRVAAAPPTAPAALAAGRRIGGGGGRAETVEFTEVIFGSDADAADSVASVGFTSRITGGAVVVGVAPKSAASFVTGEAVTVDSGEMAPDGEIVR